MVRRGANWSVTGTSAANTAKTTSKSGVSSQQLVVTAYLVVVRGAALGADTSVAIQDSDGNVLWQDYLGNAAGVGSRCGFTWPGGLELPVGKGARIVVAAGGAGAITEASLMGYML